MDSIESIISEMLDNPSRIVPVIGDQMFYYRSADGSQKPLQLFLVEELLSRKGISGVDPGEIQRMADNGYYGMSMLRRRCMDRFGFELERIYKENRDRIFLDRDVADFLRALRPEMVITTSPYRIVEQVLEDYDVRIYDGVSDADKDPILPGSHVIYHLFGLASGKNSRWVKSETELLQFLHWLHDGKTAPVKVSNSLVSKELVFLGCLFPDWLFRFLWFSIGKNESYYSDIRNDLRIDSDYVSGYWMDENRNPSPSLHDFFRDINYEAPDKVKSILQEVTHRIVQQQQQPSTLDSDNPLYDIMLSYCGSSDEELCKKVRKALVDSGIPEGRIWVSYEHQTQGDYRDRIREAIQRSRYFMPIVTTSYINRMLKASLSVPFSKLEYKGGMDLVNETIYAVQKRVAPMPLVKDGDQALLSKMSYEALEELANADRIPQDFFCGKQFFFFQETAEGTIRFTTPLDFSLFQ